MNNEAYIESLKELAKLNSEFKKMCEENPLMEYSTTQLKAELRRRKKEC